jgi:hypothetical protein
MDVLIDLRTLAELLGINYQTARRLRYPQGKGARWHEPSGFPQAWGNAHKPGSGPGGRAPVFALSEVLDWLAIHRPYDLRIALEFGNVGRELGRLDERHAERVASKASK